jgi:trk system potassium uptake protein TrkA
VKVFVIGAGLVGSAVVDALHTAHDLTVVDVDQSVLRRVGQRADVATLVADGASRSQLVKAGIAGSDLVIACTERDEVNIVAAALARIDAPGATTVVRTSSGEFVELWRDGGLDVDFVVSSELETAQAVVSAVAMPTARETATFADGQVRIIELDISATAGPDIVGRELRHAALPRDSRVVGILRGESAELPDAGTVLAVGDRIVLMASPGAAREALALLTEQAAPVESVVVYGAGTLGLPIAESIAREGIRVRVLEPDRQRAELAGEQLGDIDVFWVDGLDPSFIARERIAAADAGVFTTRDDARNLYMATLLRRHGLRCSIALAHGPGASAVYEEGGIAVSIDPREATAEEIVRFAHDPRTRQVAMLEADRFEILDVTTRAESTFVGLRIREMPVVGALIGAIVREREVVFPHGDELLAAGDRVIVFTESARAAEVERLL